MKLLPSYDRFETPEALASEADIPLAQRRKLLLEWAEDLQDKLRASDESMTSDDPGRAGALLKRVMACLDLIDKAEAPER